MQRRKPKGTFLGIDVSKIPDSPAPTPGKQARIKPSQDTQRQVKRDERAELHRKHSFISHYLNKPNATKAAILSGYSPVSAGETGSRLLKDPYVKEKIEGALERMQARTEVTVEKVLLELAKLGMSNMADYVRVAEDGSPHIDLSDLDPDQWSAVQEVNTEIEMRGPPDDQYPVKKVKIKLYSKTEALDKIARLLGGYNGKRGADDQDLPEQLTKNYTLQIGNANIVIQSGAQGEGSGSQGSEAKILALP